MFDAAAVAEQFAINLTPAAQAATGPRPRLRPGGSQAPQTSSDPNTGLRTLITLLQKHKATANLRIAGFVSQVLQEALAGMFSPHRPPTTSSKGLPLPPRPRSPTLPLLVLTVPHFLLPPLPKSSSATQTPPLPTKINK